MCPALRALVSICIVFFSFRFICGSSCISRFVLRRSHVDAERTRHFHKPKRNEHTCHSSHKPASARACKAIESALFGYSTQYTMAMSFVGLRRSLRALMRASCTPAFVCTVVLVESVRLRCDCDLRPGAYNNRRRRQKKAAAVQSVCFSSCCLSCSVGYLLRKCHSSFSPAPPPLHLFVAPFPSPSPHTRTHTRTG